MKKGEWVVCDHHRFANFTKGKKYQLINDTSPDSFTFGSTLDILNDKGERGWPSLYGYESGKIINYFMTIQDIREKKLNQIL